MPSPSHDTHLLTRTIRDRTGANRLYQGRSFTTVSQSPARQTEVPGVYINDRINEGTCRLKTSFLVRSKRVLVLDVRKCRV